MNIPKDYVQIERVNTRIGILPFIAAACIGLASCSSERTADTPRKQAPRTTTPKLSGPLPSLPPPNISCRARSKSCRRRTSSPDGVRVLQYVPCSPAARRAATSATTTAACRHATHQQADLGPPRNGSGICMEVSRVTRCTCTTPASHSAEIRSAVEETTERRYRFMTPTPHPPHGSSNRP